MSRIKVMKNLEGNEIITFYRAKGKHGFLSCLYRKKLIFEDREFDSAEHAYQFGKMRDKKTQEWVMKAPHPHLVSIVCHNLFSWDIVSGWSKMKVNRMYRVLKVKFSDIELKEKLLATGNAILIEKSKSDSFWGCGKNGKGKNMLGKLLMKVREELFKNISI